MNTLTKAGQSERVRSRVQRLSKIRGDDGSSQHGL